MAAPRKFSEKIALINQKEAEANAAYQSIMNDVNKIIRPNTSGSQLNIEQLPDNTLKSNVNIDDTIANNEQITITYDNQVYRQKSAPQSHHHKNKKQDDNRHSGPKTTDHFQPNFQQQVQHPMLANNSFLQPPNQSDSFRRARSDSSINQSAANPSDFLPNQINNQANYNQQIHPNTHHQQTPHHQHLNQHIQQLQFQYQFQPHQNQFNANNLPQQQMYSNYNSQANNFQAQPHHSQQQQNYNQNTNEFPFKNLTLPLANTNTANLPVQNNLSSPTGTMPTNTNNTNNGNNNNNSNNLSSNNLPNQIQTANSSNLNHQPSSPTALSPTMNIQPQILDSNQSSQNKQSYLLPKFVQKNESTVSSPNRNLPIYNLPSPTSQPSQTPSPTSPFNYQPSFNLNSPQPLQQQYQVTFQQPPQHQIQNMNNNLLNPNMVNTAGGSLPDLTAFQFQNNQSHQNIQIQEYNQRQQNQNQYDLQLLQPNFQQHNHIGPVKPTHNGSVSPTRGMSRYSPTNSNANLANRRPSPQRNLPSGLGLNTQPLISNTTLSAQSTPTSPLHPSMQNLPILEFTINSQHVNNYMNTNVNNNHSLLNGAGLLNNNNNGLYRSSSNGANGESLPPSPQSQQSCFNSPQGSPGPLSISPQDINPFSSNNNNYDIMQKKFDSINLDSSAQLLMNNPNIGLPSSPNLVNQMHNNGQVNANGIIGVQNILNNKQIQMNQTNIDNNNDNLNSNNINTIDSDIGANNHSIINSSRSGSLSSNGSGNNLLNNGSIYEDLQNLNSSYQQTQQQQQQQHQQQQITKQPISNQSSNPSIINKNHKNSIPNIILTFSGDSIEEKNDIIIKDLSSDLNYDEDQIDLTKTDQFDLDLQILSDPVTIDDQNSINFNEQTLYQNS